MIAVEYNYYEYNAEIVPIYILYVLKPVLVLILLLRLINGFQYFIISKCLITIDLPIPN